MMKWKWKRWFSLVMLASVLCMSGIAEERTLVIAGDVYPETVLDGYSREHPDITIQFSERDELQTLVEDAISHAANVDMYFLYLPNSTVFQQLRDREYLAEIQDESLLRYVDGMYPSLREAVCRNGVLYAVPYEKLIFPTVGVNMDVWEGIGFSAADLPHTWSDFFRFILEDWPALAEQYENLALFMGVRNAATLLQSIERTFEAYRALHDGEVGYDIPEFLEALELLREIDPEVWSEQKVYSVFSGVYASSVRDDYSNVRSLSLSMTGDDTLLATGLYVMAVNPNSPRIEQALDVMRYVVENMEPWTLEELCPEVNEPILAEYYEEEKAKYDEEMLRYERLIENLMDENLKKEIAAERDSYDVAMRAFFEVYMYDASEASIRQYREEVDGRLIPVYGTYLNDDEYRVLNEKRQQMLDGTLDVEQYVSELQRRFVMSAQEGE